MKYDNRNDNTLDIDPSAVLLRLGYATTLLVALGWLASVIA